MAIRIGNGYDVHVLVKGRPLILGGVLIPFTHGLMGHSDADAVIHSIVDALLGAAALGDIGSHFPSSDERWRNQPSSVFLDAIHDMLKKNHWSISNVDVTIYLLCELTSPNTSISTKNRLALRQLPPMV